MILKEYIVVKSATGSINLWTKGVYERYLKGHIIGDGTGAPYIAITTFDANEELKEGGGIPWVKASERVPEAQGRAYYLRFITPGSFHAKAVGYFYKDRGGQTLVKFHSGTNGDCDPSEIEWLDEYAAQFAGTREEERLREALNQIKIVANRCIVDDTNPSSEIRCIYDYILEVEKEG